ncbi:sugar kinase [bacterium]|nr:sugar kinase [candidate division CSSED10-310 bacterium]
MSVLVVGSIALDSVTTPTGQHNEMLGGSATYFSLAASRFSPVNVVGVVGEDFPETYKNLLMKNQIDITGIQISKGKTFRWKGEYSGSMNEARTLDTQLNVFQNFSPVIPRHYRNSKWVFLGNIHPELQLRVIEQIENAKLFALDTMNFWIDGYLQMLRKTLKHVQLLIINENEIRMLSGEINITRAVTSVQKMGPSTVIVKRGEYGSLMYHDKSWFYVPGYPESLVVDPTGAGDSFAGGFMGSLARSGKVTTGTLKKAMIYGSVMASFNITSFGPWKLAEITGSEVEQRFKLFRALVALRV